MMVRFSVICVILVVVLLLCLIQFNIEKDSTLKKKLMTSQSSIKFEHETKKIDFKLQPSLQSIPKLYKDLKTLHKIGNEINNKAKLNHYVQDEYRFHDSQVLKRIIATEKKIVYERLAKFINRKRKRKNETPVTITNLRLNKITHKPSTKATNPNPTKSSARSYKPIKKISSSPMKTVKKLTTKTLPLTALITAPKTTANSHDKYSTVRQDYNFINPQSEDLEKLSDLPLESTTDPLKYSAKCNKEVYLLILVVSQPKNFDRRQNIRDSWKYSYENNFNKIKKPKEFQDGQKYSPTDVVKVVFILGQSKEGNSMMNKIRQEQKDYNDIVIGSLQEDYRNLTLKTRLGLKWSYYDCRSKYTIKTDDDVFVNPVVLVEWLKEKPLEKFYTGWCNFGSPVLRDKNSKWYVSYEDFTEEKYPGYCLGGGYLMSSDVVGAVLKKSYGRKLFPMEDLYVGLMISEMKDIEPRDERKHFDLVYSGRNNDCDLNNLYLAHQVFGNNLIKHTQRAAKALVEC